MALPLLAAIPMLAKAGAAGGAVAGGAGATGASGIGTASAGSDVIGAATGQGGAGGMGSLLDLGGLMGGSDQDTSRQARPDKYSPFKYDASSIGNLEAIIRMKGLQDQAQANDPNMFAKMDDRAMRSGAFGRAFTRNHMDFPTYSQPVAPVAPIEVAQLDTTKIRKNIKEGAASGNISQDAQMREIMGSMGSQASPTGPTQVNPATTPATAGPKGRALSSAELEAIRRDQARVEEKLGLGSKKLFDEETEAERQARYKKMGL